MQTKVSTEIPSKDNKEKILIAYNEVLNKLNKKFSSLEEELKQKHKQEAIEAISDNSESAILIDISTLKIKLTKQVDILSEQFLTEFKKLTNLRNAVISEQKHLEELYQIKETTNTLSVLLQVQVEQEELFKIEFEKAKKEFEKEKKAQQLLLEEERILAEKLKKREEEEYTYTQKLRRSREEEEYNKKKADKKEELLNKENQIKEKEEFYESLQQQIEQMPEKIKEACILAEERLRTELLRKHEFDSILKAQEYNSMLKLQEQSIKYLEDKVKKQEVLIESLSQKADSANSQIQSIAYKALDISTSQFVSVTPQITRKNTK